MGGERRKVVGRPRTRLWRGVHRFQVRSWNDFSAGLLLIHAQHSCSLVHTLLNLMIKFWSVQQRPDITLPCPLAMALHGIHPVQPAAATAPDSVGMLTVITLAIQGGSMHMFGLRLIREADRQRMCGRAHSGQAVEGREGEVRYGAEHKHCILFSGEAVEHTALARGPRTGPLQGSCSSHSWTWLLSPCVRREQALDEADPCG